VLVTVSSHDGLPAAVLALEEGGMPWAVLGGGSNLLVADCGFRGAVLKLDEGFQYVERAEGAGDDVGVVVGGAVLLPQLTALLADEGLGGLEWAAGIPGTLGGAVLMNAGAHDAAMSDAVAAVRIATPQGDRWLEPTLLSFEYRSADLPRAAVVSAARLRLYRDDPAAVQARRRELLRDRRRQQPRGGRSFGCAFRNPPGDSAGRLLERAGMKGIRRGGAEVSARHANFIVNVGEASATDVLMLMGMMRETVQRREGVVLDPEVRLLGAAFPWEPLEGPTGG